MKIHLNGMKRIAAALLVLVLLTAAAPMALAESFSCYVKSSGGAGVYSNYALTKRVTSLDQYAVVTVVAWDNSVCAIQYNGGAKKGFCATKNLQPIEGNCEEATVTQKTKVYQKASTSSSSASVAKGTKVNVIREGSNGWTLVEKDGVGAYIKSQYLQTASWSSPEDFTATATPKPTATPDASKSVEAVVTASKVQVYSKPEASSKYKYGTMSKGTKCNVLTIEDGWAYVEKGGLYGYCALSALTVASETTAEPTATPKPTATPDASKSVEAVVTASKVQVYSKPEASSKYKYGTMSKGTKCNVLKIEDGWAYVEKGGLYGYCALSALTVASEATAEPTATPKPTATPDASKSVEAVVTASKVQVYSKPEASSKYKYGTMSKGTKCNVLKIEDGWAYVEKGGLYGYCALSALTVASETTAEPTATPAPTATPDASSAVEAVVIVDKVQVYSKPEASSKYKYGTMSKGTKCNVLKIEDGWAYVEKGGLYGYCALSALTVASETTAEPTATPAPTATPDASSAVEAVVIVDKVQVYSKPEASSKYKYGTMSKGTECRVLKTSGGWAYVEKGGLYGYCALSALSPKTDATATPAPTSTNGIEAVVTISKVQVYSKPKASSKYKYGTMSKGTVCTVLSVKDGWAYVEKGGLYGYCSMSALTYKTDVTPAPTMTADPSNAVAAVVVKAVDVYSLPSTDAKEIGGMSVGTLCDVLATSGDWAYVRKEGNYGYCKKSALTTLTDMKSVPKISGFKLSTFSATVVYGDAEFWLSVGDSSRNTKIARGTGVTVYAYSSSLALVDVGGVKGFMEIKNLNRETYAELKQGSSGSNVKVLETRLFTLGYLTATPDTKFNAETASAVKAFQKQAGMKETGVADQNTLRVLYTNEIYSETFAKTYSKGDSGDAVKLIQYRLYELGYLKYSSSVDGSFGANTEKAVKLFQKYTSGLSETGKVDSATLKALYKTNAASLPSGVNPGDYIDLPQVTVGDQENNSPTISSKLASSQSTYSSGMSNEKKIEYIVYLAQNQLGKPYVYAEEGPSSYDCTGLTYYCFKKIGITLKRTAIDQGYDSKYEKIESSGSLKRGDLVYFNTVADNDLSDHAGIYLGSGYFIHASSGQGKVVVSTLSSGYYSRVFSWGRRVL